MLRRYLIWASLSMTSTMWRSISCRLFAYSSSVISFRSKRRLRSLSSLTSSSLRVSSSLNRFRIALASAAMTDPHDIPASPQINVAGSADGKARSSSDSKRINDKEAQGITVGMASSGLATTWVVFTVEGLGAFSGKLLRFLAPRTVDAIVRNLPLNGRVTQMPGSCYFQVGLRLGVEKARRRFNRGEIAYWPLADAICLFYREVTLYTPANPIGSVEHRLEIAEEAKSGQRINVVTQRLPGIS